MPPQTIRIPYDSNLRYLPLVYLLPEELMSRCPTLMKIPRNPYQVLQSNEWLDLIDSDQFFDEIMDAVSSLVFPFFGFRCWKEHYTGDFPVWRLSYVFSLAHTVGQPENQPAFADFGGTGQDIYPFAEQLFDQPAGRLKLHIHQFIGVDSFQLRDLFAECPLNVPDRFPGCHARMTEQNVVQQIPCFPAGHAKPGIIFHESCQITADRANYGEKLCLCVQTLRQSFSRLPLLKIS